MKPVSRKDYEAQIEKLARDAFKDHVLLEESTADPHAARWVVGRPGWSSVYLTEIVFCARTRHLVIIDGGVYFANDRSAEDAIRWFARSTDLAYLASKVRLGSKMTTDAEVAISDIEYQLSEDAWSDSSRAAFRDALYHLRRGDSVEEVRTFLYEADVDSEAVFDIGEVVNSDIFYSREAARTLVRLLDARDAKQEGVTP